MCMSYYNFEPDENKRPLFAVVKAQPQQANEEAEGRNPVSEIEICEPQNSIAPEDIRARLSINEFEV